MKLKSEYTAAWLAWILLLCVAEFVAPLEVRRWALPTVLVMFGFVEGLAVWRRGSGDTFSEHVWAFYAGRPARAPLVLGVVGLLACRLYETGAYDTLSVGTLDLGRTCLVLGLVGWLVPHFLWEGRLG